MDSDFDSDINCLRGFVSDTIFEFLAGEVATPLPVDPATSSSSTLTDEELLLACKSIFEPPAKRPKVDTISTNGNASKTSATARTFSPPKTEQEIQQARIGAIPKKTQSDTKYCIGMWDEWRYHRLVNYQDNIPEITQD